MALEYVDGNLISSNEGVMVHGCNSKGKFGKGFALAVKEASPVAHKVYDDAHKAGILILGSVVWAADGGRVFGHAITQPTYGKTGVHLSMPALEAALREVDVAAVMGIPGTRFKDGFDRVAMPMIGSGLGGGNWDEIEALIEKTIVNARPVVYRLPANRPGTANARRPRS